MNDTAGSSTDRPPEPLIHPSTAAILAHFEYRHLSTDLQEVSKPFCDLARALGHEPTLVGAELTTALRKLLEAKDCAVRARLDYHRLHDKLTPPAPASPQAKRPLPPMS